MSPRLVGTLWDLLGLAVGLWALVFPPFPTVPAAIVQGAALFVIGSSLWRLWQRWRARP